MPPVSIPSMFLALILLVTGADELYIYLSVSIRKEELGQQDTTYTAVALSVVQTVVSISQNSSISNSNLSRLIRNHV